jgi:hypothetical protein
VGYSDVERDGAVRPFVNEAADFVPVALPLFEEREDENLRAAALQLTLEQFSGSK